MQKFGWNPWIRVESFQWHIDLKIHCGVVKKQNYKNSMFDLTNYGSNCILQ